MTILNFILWDSVIENELIYLVSNKNQDKVLIEYAEYLEKINNFSHTYLWKLGLVKNPINWWYLVKGRYPILSEVAIKILSILVTSASREPAHVEHYLQLQLQVKEIGIHLILYILK